MTFNEYRKKYNTKFPLSKLMFDYYCNLGYSFFVVQNLCGYHHLV